MDQYRVREVSLREPSAWDQQIYREYIQMGRDGELENPPLSQEQ